MALATFCSGPSGYEADITKLLASGARVNDRVVAGEVRKAIQSPVRQIAENAGTDGSATIASRLLILRRPPFSATVTGSFSLSLSSAVKLFAPAGRPRGLPDLPFTKRVSRGGLP